MSAAPIRAGRRRRNAAARELQRSRFPAGSAAPLNAALVAADLRAACPLDAAGQTLLDSAFDRLGFSARALYRVLKVARTIADLAAAERIGSAHLAEAIQYRALDRRLQP